MSRIKLILFQLIAAFVLIHPLYSQEIQNETKNDSILPDEHELKNTPGLWLNRRGQIFLNPKIPITSLTLKHRYNSFPNSILFNKTPGQAFLYDPSQIQTKITVNQPLKNDFNKSKSDWIFGKFFILTGSIAKNYIGLGEYLQLGIGLKWIPYHRLSFDAGSFYSRQYNFFSGLRSDIYGLNTRTTIDLTGKLQFTMHGQYVGNSNTNFFYGNILFPNSNIGSSFLYKVKKQTQIEVGVQYQYYESKKIWDMESASKISIGF